ncbi:MAG: type II toxin-antitoxin system VapC family toxin [Candidatus Limnocylindrales bacterium]
MLIVVDASVILQVSIAGGALGPLSGHDMIAPPLLASEVTSILCEMAYRSQIPPERARRAVTGMNSLPIRFDRPDGLAERAWDIARSLGRARSYDAEYVALAQIHDSPLLTIDERMRRGAGHVVEMPTPQELIGR